MTTNHGAPVPPATCRDCGHLKGSEPVTFTLTLGAKSYPMTCYHGAAAAAAGPRVEPLVPLDGQDWKHTIRDDVVRIGSIEAKRVDWIAALHRLGADVSPAAIPGETPLPPPFLADYLATAAIPLIRRVQYQTELATLVELGEACHALAAEAGTLRDLAQALVDSGASGGHYLGVSSEKFHALKDHLEAAR